MITKQSKYFAAALKKEWRANRSQPVSLSGEDPDMVSAYVQWLYSGKIFVTKHDSNGDASYWALCQLYGLGERLMDDSFQDYIVIAIFDLMKHEHPVNKTCAFPDEVAINSIYQNTPVDSPLRRLLVDINTANAESDWVKTASEGAWDVDAAFKDNLIASLLAFVTEQSSDAQRWHVLTDGGLCKYHKHGADQLCSHA